MQNVFILTQLTAQFVCEIFCFNIFAILVQYADILQHGISVNLTKFRIPYTDEAFWYFTLAKMRMNINFAWLS